MQPKRRIAAETRGPTKFQKLQLLKGKKALKAVCKRFSSKRTKEKI
jgi:hypothetical protein